MKRFALIVAAAFLLMWCWVTDSLIMLWIAL